MKNTLFTGIAGENPAVLLNREQALAIKVHHNHREAYSVVGKIYLRQQVEDRKEHAI